MSEFGSCRGKEGLPTMKGQREPVGHSWNSELLSSAFLHRGARAVGSHGLTEADEKNGIYLDFFFIQTLQHR